VNRTTPISEITVAIGPLFRNRLTIIAANSPNTAIDRKPPMPASERFVTAP
jgi:hypothetical protein